MRIYFAASIRGGREVGRVCFEMIEVLKQYGHVLTEHIGSASLDRQGEALADREIYDRDFAWLKSSDILVAEVTTPSLGVGFEIGKATEWDKPVLCVRQRNGNHVLSAMIAGNRAVTVRDYSALADFEDIVREFMSIQGKPPVRQERAAPDSI
jgi:nucleoside 2-deoxyribosyltransferase